MKRLLLFFVLGFPDRGRVGFEEEEGLRQRRGMEDYMFAFDSDLAPIVGQQLTLSDSNRSQVALRLNLLLARAAAPFTSKILGGEVTECEVVVHGTQAGQPHGWLYEVASDTFLPDAASAPPLELADFHILAASEATQFTFTCVPPGSGWRIALDRDLDGLLNGDDPATALLPSHPSVGIQP